MRPGFVKQGTLPLRRRQVRIPATADGRLKIENSQVGVFLVSKRLEAGRFTRPPVRDRAVTLSAAQLPAVCSARTRRRSRHGAPSRRMEYDKVADECRRIPNPGGYPADMGSDPAALPRDPDQLIEMVISLQDDNGKLRTIADTLKRTCSAHGRSGSLHRSAAALGFGDCRHPQAAAGAEAASGEFAGAPQIA